MWKIALAGSLALGLVACEEKSSKMTLGTADAGACDVKIDALADTEWLFLKANPDKSEVPEHKTRMRFFNEDGKLKVKYNVGSVADMYTYVCEAKGEEQICKEEPKVKDWCQALLAGGAECNAETLRKYEPSLTDDEIKTAVEEATANVAKYKDTPQWKQFQLNNNNVGNKLRGLLYVKVDKSACRLRVTDNFMTIFNGKRLEDSNPAGTNPFVKNDMGPLLWEHCTNKSDLISLTSDAFPEDPQNAVTVTKHKAGDPVHYWYLAGDTLAPIEGCTFTYDVWRDGKPGETGQAPSVDESGKQPRMKWLSSHTWADKSPTLEGNVTTWVINSKCDDPKKLGEGWKDGKRVACNAVLIQ
jgi:hypothetical protein